MATLVEHDNSYIERAIIDHPQHGRIYAVMMRSHEAMPPTWEDGLAFFVKPDDTLESIDLLKDKEINSYCTTAYDSMLNGYDDDRPIIAWSGYDIGNMVRALINNQQAS